MSKKLTIPLGKFKSQFFINHAMIDIEWRQSIKDDILDIELLSAHNGNENITNSFESLLACTHQDNYKGVLIWRSVQISAIN